MLGLGQAARRFGNISTTDWDFFRLVLQLNVFAYTNFLQCYFNLS